MKKYNKIFISLSALCVLISVLLLYPRIARPRIGDVSFECRPGHCVLKSSPWVDMYIIPNTLSRYGLYIRMINNTSAHLPFGDHFTLERFDGESGEWVYVDNWRENVGFALFFALRPYSSIELSKPLGWYFDAPLSRGRYRLIKYVGTHGEGWDNRLIYKMEFFI